MEIFIKEFRTTNKLLLKERSNLLSELKIKVNEVSKVMSNVLILKNEVNGVTTRGGEMTSEATSSKEINKTRINESEPPRFEQDVQEKPHDDVVKNKSSSICERTTQPLVKPQQSSIPFPKRVRIEKEEVLQQIFLENLKQLDINIPFIESLMQIPKYAKYLKSLMMNKLRLEEACTEIMNERCSAVLLNKIPLKKDPMSFTIPCQVLEKHKEGEDLAADHLSRFENPHMKVLNEREIADKFSDEHLMEQIPIKTYFWEEPYAFKLCVNNIMRRCVAGSETLEILAHSHSGPTSGHHSANVTAKKLEKALQRYGVTHKLSMTYHPQSNGQTKVTNRAIKNILERSVGYNPKGWSEKLLMHYEHLGRPTKHQQGVYLSDYESRLMQLNELAELRDGAYENTRIYKERTKKWHDSGLRGDKDFKVGDKNGFKFKINGQRLKKYYKGDIDKEDDDVIEFENGVT
ncbi:reverse transcriptase domain-containing protein [Tanacetum coccineum]